MITIPEHILDESLCHAVLKDWLSLQGPTVKEIRSNNFPISTAKTSSILHFREYLSLAADSPFPRLKSLALDARYLSSSILAWVKLHINELQSLKCGSSSIVVLPELLAKSVFRNLERIGD